MNGASGAVVVTQLTPGIALGPTFGAAVETGSVGGPVGAVAGIGIGAAAATAYEYQQTWAAVDQEQATYAEELAAAHAMNQAFLALKCQQAYHRSKRAIWD